MRSDSLRKTARGWRIPCGLLALSSLVPACSSGGESPPSPPDAARPTAPAPATDDATRQDVAHLKSEVLSLSEKMRTLERNVEVLLKGRRSGLYDDANPSGGGIDFPQESASPLTQTNEIPAGRILDPSGGTSAAPSGASPAPQEAIADAELRMQRGQYGEAVVILSEVRKANPAFADEGHSSLLLADCWNHLKQHENAIQELRSFYLKNPKSAHLLRGKILEAQAYEGMGSRDRALGLYREVVSLGPKTGYAQTARSAMQRLRDER